MNAPQPARPASPPPSPRTVVLRAPALDPSDSVPDGDLDEIEDGAVDLPANRFSNRELSWLAFNARVLALAEDRRQPLLERLKFLAIFASNLDEFYMVRVSGLKRRTEMGFEVGSFDGTSSRATLAQLATRSRELSSRNARCFLEDIEPAL